MLQRTGLPAEAHPAVCASSAESPRGFRRCLVCRCVFAQGSVPARRFPRFRKPRADRCRAWQRSQYDTLARALNALKHLLTFLRMLPDTAQSILACLGARLGSCAGFSGHPLQRQETLPPPWRSCLPRSHFLLPSVEDLDVSFCAALPRRVTDDATERNEAEGGLLVRPVLTPAHPESGAKRCSGMGAGPSCCPRPTVRLRTSKVSAAGHS